MRGFKMRSVFALTLLSSIGSTLSLQQIPLQDYLSNDGGNPTATIDSGVVIGTTTIIPSATVHVNKFLGIPFAKSPPDRFRLPESPEPFADPLIAQQFSPACIQQWEYPKEAADWFERMFNNPPAEESEDCLYLNVFVPSTPAPPDGWAVMYWIHGGSLENGNAGHRWHDGSIIARTEDVIVVSANYRTNVFGFPASLEIPPSERNLGFLDQRFGLEWVQRNIRSFGGNSSKVTIFGQSAGGLAVDALLTSYSKDMTPPFRAAIAMSGQMSFRAVSRFAPSTEAWQQLSIALGCSADASKSLECVRAAPASEIRRIINVRALTFRPTHDNFTLMRDPNQRRARGELVPVPVMGGSTAQEARTFTVNQTDARVILRTLITDDDELIEEIMAAYPLGKDGIDTGYHQVSAILTDMSFHCPQAIWANATAEADIPTWRYYYNASFPNTEIYPDLGVFHGSELPMVFGTFRFDPPVTEEQRALSSSMRHAWARFAKDPYGGPGWTRVGRNKVLDLAVFGNVGNSFEVEPRIINERTVDCRCDLFDGFLQA